MIAMARDDGDTGWTGHGMILITGLATKAAFQMRTPCADSHQGPGLSTRPTERPDISTQSHRCSAICRLAITGRSI